MRLYQTCEDHAKNNDEFKKFMQRYAWAKFYQPNAEKSPWHWKCSVRGEGPYIVEINFWPHVGKAQREYCASVRGWDNIRSLMTEIIEENGYGGEVLE